MKVAWEFLSGNRQYLVQKIAGKVSKLSLMTFAYCSCSYLFYDHIPCVQ
jgi:hypothetical protein